MREIKVIKYQAEDGSIFDTKEECIAYELHSQRKIDKLVQESKRGDLSVDEKL